MPFLHHSDSDRGRYRANLKFCSTSARSHTPHRSTVSYVLSLLGLSSHPHAHMRTHVHREMRPHTAKKTARLIQIRKHISIPLFELNRLAQTVIWLFVHMLNNTASMTKAWLMFLNVCISWQYLKIIPSGRLFISLTRLLITNTSFH